MRRRSTLLRSPVDHAPGAPIALSSQQLDENVTPSDLSLTVCIPFYGKPAEIVQRAVLSAAKAMPDKTELLVLPNGADACSELRRIALPGEAHVIESERELSLVENWNRCLSTSQGSLVHILHDDDVVTPEFYEAIIELRRRHPQAALYGTGAASLDGRSEDLSAMKFEASFYAEGDDAATFILQDGRYYCGSTILSRRVIESEGLFRDEFRYGPDEEAFLRYAARGGFAFNPSPYYRATIHRQQTRFATWGRSDFVRTYVQSRVEGAGRFSPAVREVALRSSARRVISVAVSLALEGRTDAALHQLRELESVVPRCRRWPRYWVARGVLKSHILRALAGQRRKRVFGRRRS